MTDEGLPHKGTMRINYFTEPKCAVPKLRSALGKFCYVGKGKTHVIPKNLLKGTQAKRLRRASLTMIAFGGGGDGGEGLQHEEEVCLFAEEPLMQLYHRWKFAEPVLRFC